MKRMMFGIAAAAVVLALPWRPAAARQAAEHRGAEKPAAEKPAAAGTLGSAGAWTAYASSDKTGRVCYVVGQPHKSESAGIQRRPPSAMVTHRPAENIANVVSFVEGYGLKDGSDVVLDVGDRKFELFTKEDSAWARTAELDRAIVATLAKGKSAVVKGTAANGRTSVDVYTLAGFDKALALIDRACGVKRETAPRPAHPAPRHAKHRPAHPAQR